MEAKFEVGEAEPAVARCAQPRVPPFLCAEVYLEPPLTSI